MYHKIEGGSVIEVQDNAFGFVFKCNLPPVGYGRNIMTGEIEQTDIICRSEIPEEQFYERITLTKDYKAKRKHEEQRQNYNPKYVDNELEGWRVKEWRRRLCGVWFKNYNPTKKESELIYLTGLNYFYINWWKFDGKWNDFRITDRDFFYVAYYCMDDPYCLGVNEIAKRKQGKTARAGCILYERTSRLSNHHAGIQSKTDEDSEEVFKKAVVAPWKILPHFYRPIWDLMKGDTPTQELRFFNTAKRGQRAEEETEDDSLNSFIDFKSRNVDGYDGPLVLTYLSDESGKLKKDVSISERQNRVRFSREDIGHYADTFHLFTTTVEIEDNSKSDDYSDEFQKLTLKSNPLERNLNGHTGTGLYTYFTPAYKSTFFDRYGYPDEIRARTYFENTRKSLEDENDLRGLSSFKRKNPFTLKEAFSVDGQDSLYNPELLNRQLDNIQWQTGLTELGNLEWKDGNVIKKQMQDGNGEYYYVPSELVWVSDAKGEYEKIIGWFPKEQNCVVINNGQFSPNANNDNRIGCDPFKFDKTKSKRRSNCAAFNYQLSDSLFPNEFDDHFTLRYVGRPESTALSNNAVLKMAWWCGCQVLFERNVDHWKKDFMNLECGGFLMWLPGEVEPGIPPTTGNTQNICDYTERYINKHIDKVYFQTLLKKETGWLGFKVDDTEKFDEPMAAGYTLIAVKERKYQQKGKLVDIKNYFPNQKVWAY